MNTRLRSIPGRNRRAVDDVPTLSSREIAALRSNSPKAEDIVNNLEFAAELNSEIRGTYNQEDATMLAMQEGLALKPLEEPYMPEDDLERRVREAAEQAAALAEEKARRDRMRAEKAVQPKPAPKAKPPELSFDDEEPESDVDPEVERVNNILDVFKTIKGAPSSNQIQQLKASCGNSLYAIAFDENEAYLFTHLRRAELRRAQEYIQKQTSMDGFSQTAEDALKEKVLTYCVKWPLLTVEFFQNSRAGVIDTLFEMIMVNSYMLTTQQAMFLTAKL